MRNSVSEHFCLIYKMYAHTLAHSKVHYINISKQLLYLIFDRLHTMPICVKNIEMSFYVKSCQTAIIGDYMFAKNKVTQLLFTNIDDRDC
jgi:hypothetical protein